jgi:hypothetical protein
MRHRPRPLPTEHNRLLRSIERNTRASRDEVAKLAMLAEDLREHELIKQGRSRLRAFAYNIMLGVAFALGTVLGLVMLSWMTFHYFQDSPILRDVIQRQLQIRNFDFDRLREEAAKSSVDFGGIFGDKAPN